LWTHRLTRREWFATAGGGSLQNGKRAGASRHEPARLALPIPPQVQRSGTVVSSERRRGQKAQDHDRGARPQTAHCAVAVPHHRRSTRGCGPAPDTIMSEIKEAIRPVFHQLEARVEAHVFIAFLAYCLHVTLARRLLALAPGLTPRSVLEKFAAMQMIDLHLPTTDGRELL